jgi:hypothetical protein
VLKYSATKLFSEAIKKYEPDSAESWLLSEGFSSVEVCQVKLRFDDSDGGLGSFTPKLLRGLGLEEIRELAARVGGPTDRGHLDAGGAAATAAQQAAEEHGGAEEAPDEWSDSSEDERLFAS